MLFSTFLMWLLADLFPDLPEIGDPDKPKLMFFFDEAHLLFDDASKAFLDAIAQTVRLIRSKGVGVFFVTQTPKDVPDDVLAQLSNRVQHAARVHPRRRKGFEGNGFHVSDLVVRPRPAAPRSAPVRRSSPCCPSAARRRRWPGPGCARPSR